MSRVEEMVRGTDTRVHGVRTRVTASAPFQQYLSSLRDDEKLDPNDALTAALSTTMRRKAGAFFTGAALANALVSPFSRELKGDARVMDPACGAGDLLIAAAKHFRVAKDAEHRLEDWQGRIYGRDLFEEFVLSARLRMFRASRVDWSEPDLANLFPGIQHGCSLSSQAGYDIASHVLLNPPYTLVRAPESCEWRNGRVSAAALFMEVVAKSCAPGTRIGAVLPDVLRSGSGYEKWRALLGQLLEIDQLTIIGRFARWADVDVFLLHGRVRRSSVRNKRRWPSPSTSDQKLSDHSSISVGPLVDYRSPKEGTWSPYLTVDDAPPWGRVCTSDLRLRRFSGRTVRPPIVVVRRTSRVGDTHRMVPSIVTGNHAVAVENHLIVIEPRDRTVRSCESIAARLRDSRTTQWLDERIRCRHLTVGAVKELPWWDVR